MLDESALTRDGWIGGRMRCDAAQTASAVCFGLFDLDRNPASRCVVVSFDMLIN